MHYVVSDIHGHYEKYRRLLGRIDLRPRDTLFVVGDMIDRGPDGCRLLLDMMERVNVFPISGNHELTAAFCLPWLIREVTELNIQALGEQQLGALGEWVANGGGVTLRELQTLGPEERESILEYIRGMDLFMELEVRGRSFVLVHAGLDNFAPEKPLESYTPEELLFARPDAGTVYYPDKTVILGHTPTRFLGGGDRILKWGNIIDIDCGCAGGGPLGCLCLETMEEFYI